jgi:hypothetical protein
MRFASAPRDQPSETLMRRLPLPATRSRSSAADDELQDPRGHDRWNGLAGHPWGSADVGRPPLRARRPDSKTPQMRGGSRLRLGLGGSGRPMSGCKRASSRLVVARPRLGTGERRDSVDDRDAIFVLGLSTTPIDSEVSLELDSLGGRRRAGSRAARPGSTHQSASSMSTGGRSCTSSLVRLSRTPSSTRVTVAIGIAT